LAHIAAQDDTVVIEACRLVESDSPDETERADALALRTQLELAGDAKRPRVSPDQ
jgi:hypothetical protein